LPFNERWKGRNSAHQPKPVSPTPERPAGAIRLLDRKTICPRRKARRASGTLAAHRRGYLMQRSLTT
jgi:hypothetical protein